MTRVAAGLCRALIAIAAVTLGGWHAHPVEAQMEPERWEASTSLDLADLEPVLRLVAKEVEEGFGEPEIQGLASAVRQLDVDQEHDQELRVQYQGESVMLTIHVAMDDVVTPDVYFYSSRQPLADRIAAVVRGYMDARGR